MSSAPEVKLHVPEHLRRGNLRKDERASVDSAHALLAIVERRAALAGAKILDFGCGVKIVQALLEREYRQRKYVGVDVFRDIIDFLRANVADPRFEFAALDFHNEKYNPQGERMSGGSRLPIADDFFDVITMFSVITHMVPDDALATFRILRGYAAPAGTLIFSTFIDPGQERDFVDRVPDRPLLKACYRKPFLDELVRQGGWKIESFEPPVAGVIEHHYSCRPA